MQALPDYVVRHRLTVADFDRMGEAGLFAPDTRVELIEGEIVDMSPIGSRHAGTVAYLAEQLSRATGDRALTWVQQPIVIGKHSEPEPDIALLKRRSDYYAIAHPGANEVLLLIEVADSSLRYDHDVKLPLYAASGVTASWLVDLDGQRLEMFGEPTSGRYARMQAPSDLGNVPLPSPLDGSVDLSSLFGLV